MIKILFGFITLLIGYGPAFATPAEVKVEVHPQDIFKALKTFNNDETVAEKKLIYFLDTPQRTLARKGHYLRLRGDRVLSKATAVYKFKVSSIGEEKNHITSQDCEYDASGQRIVLMCSLKNSVKGEFSKYSDEPKSAFENLFSENQQESFRKNIEQEFELANLEWIGPIQAYRWKNLNFESELWVMPGFRGVYFYEISARVLDKSLIPSKTLELQNFLKKNQIRESKNPRTKTERALLGY